MMTPAAITLGQTGYNEYFSLGTISSWGFFFLAFTFSTLIFSLKSRSRSKSDTKESTNDYMMTDLLETLYCAVLVFIVMGAVYPDALIFKLFKERPCPFVFAICKQIGSFSLGQFIFTTSESWYNQVFD